MQRHSFNFIKDPVLRENLQITLSHTINLIALREDLKLKGVARSSFTKTAIIYIASIIEALLLWKLKKKLGGKTEVELKKKWVYKNPKVVYIIEENPLKEIVCCIRQREVKKLNKLDFYQINRLCLNYEIISKPLFNKVDKVRNLRNRLHIGSLKTIERGYTKKELAFSTSVLEEVLQIVSK